MGNNHLRVFLEGGHDGDDRDVLLGGEEGGDQIATHVEVNPAGQKQRLVVHLWAAGDDGNVQTAGLIGAVGDGLIETAVLGLGEPVGAEHHLFKGKRWRNRANGQGGGC